VLARAALIIYQLTALASLDSGLTESLALEVSEYVNIRVLTLFLGQVATKMWQDFDYSYSEKNKSRMLHPQDVAEKIAEMIFDATTYKNGDSVEMYGNM
jgi:3-oxoacyl-[acyl-carrier protein] reductase